MLQEKVTIENVSENVATMLTLILRERKLEAIM